MRVTMQIILIGLALSGPLDVAAAAPGNAGDFLEAMAGSFRGRGSAVFPGSNRPERIVCQVANRYDGDARSLVVNGECATAQGKSAVSGEMRHAGAGVSGSLLGNFDGSTITRSSGTVNNGALTVQTSFVDDATGNLTETRQVMHLSQDGFIAEFYTLNRKTKAYDLTGTMTFSSRKAN